MNPFEKAKLRAAALNIPWREVSAEELAAFDAENEELYYRDRSERMRAGHFGRLDQLLARRAAEAQAVLDRAKTTAAEVLGYQNRRTPFLTSAAHSPHKSANQ